MTASKQWTSSHRSHTDRRKRLRTLKRTYTLWVSLSFVFFLFSFSRFTVSPVSVMDGITNILATFCLMSAGFGCVYLSKKTEKRIKEYAAHYAKSRLKALRCKIDLI